MLLLYLQDRCGLLVHVEIINDVFYILQDENMRKYDVLHSLRGYNNIGFTRAASSLTAEQCIRIFSTQQ